MLTSKNKSVLQIKRNWWVFIMINNYAPEDITVPNLGLHKYTVLIFLKIKTWHDCKQKETAP